jgi:hypothetical protein
MEVLDGVSQAAWVDGNSDFSCFTIIVWRSGRLHEVIWDDFPLVATEGGYKTRLSLRHLVSLVILTHYHSPTIQEHS